MRDTVAAEPDPAKSAASVTAPLAPPPVRPVPAVTPVTSPPLFASAAQVQVVPLSLGICPFEQASAPSPSLSAAQIQPAPLRFATCPVAQARVASASSSAAQIQPAPLRFGIWPAAQARPASASSSTSSANPDGFPWTPSQGAASAFGTAFSSWRPAMGVKAPVLAPSRTPTASQRASPWNAAAPKSSGTVNRPSSTATSSTTTAGSTGLPPAASS